MVLFQTDTQSVTHIQMAAIIFDRTIKADEKWAKLQKLSGAEDDTPETVKWFYQLERVVILERKREGVSHQTRQILRVLW